jgi:glycosyltransferase involved in cell wall biosynthesis
MPRRVLSVSTLYPNAAQPRFGTFVAHSLEALAARGEWDVTLINPIGVPPLRFGSYGRLAQAAVSGSENGVGVHRPLFGIVPGISARWNAQSIVRAVLPLARKLHAEAPFDLVDAQFFFPDGPAAAAIARDLGLPLSIKARGADIQYWGRKPWCRGQILAAGQQAAGLLAVSEALVDDMVALGLPRSKITVHYTGLDHARFRPLGRKPARAALAGTFGIDPGAEHYLLSSVGALIPRKGQELAIEALVELPRAVLALVGKGPDEAGLRTLAKRLGVADRVHFLGSLDHDSLPLLLTASHAMVLPAASEGLANAWVEALACGTPLVIADAGGARELVKAPSAGRIVERSAPAIVQAVKALIAAPYNPDAVAANASGFSWETNAATLAAYYERLIGRD